MNMPRHIKVKPNQVATLAWVVLQIGVALLGTDFGMIGDRRDRAVGNDEAVTSDDAVGQSINQSVAARNSRLERRCTPFD
jgi:hypothetical protein